MRNSLRNKQVEHLYAVIKNTAKICAKLKLMNPAAYDRMQQACRKELIRRGAKI